MMAALRVAPNGVAVAAGFKAQTVRNPLTGGKQGCFFERGAPEGRKKLIITIPLNSRVEGESKDSERPTT